MTIKKKGVNRIRLHIKTHEASVSLDWYGDKKTWLLTAYEKDETSASDKTMNTVDNQQDLQSDSSANRSSSEGKDNSNPSNLQENEDISSANPEEKDIRFSVDEDEAGLSHVKKYVQSIIVPKQITSLAQAAQWTYNALGRIKGMLNRLYSERGSKDFSMGLLSTDPDKGREMDIEKAMYSRGRVKQYLDFVQQVVDFRS